MKSPFSLIQTEENTFQTQSIKVADNYEWSFYNHVLTSTLYKNSIYLTGKDDNKPFKNITRPILNLQHRAEGFDVDDIELFVDSEKDYHKSFLVKKFHEKWARENELDTLIDNIVESYVDYGGALVKNKDKPEVVPLQRLAFCDQTDILGGPICEKHYFTIDQLREMNGKWENVEEVVALAQNKKTVGAQKTEQDTAGTYVEIYELHGTFPEHWLDENPDFGEESDPVRQLHIITFFQDEENKKQGITLFKGKEKDLPYKFLSRDPIFGRALGLGGAEELFEPQVWVNYDVIRMKGMLDEASKVIYQTADKKFATRNKTGGLDNGEVLVYEDGKPISQVDTTPRNIVLFQNSIVEWEAHAQQMGAANDTIMGEPPKSGTPFKLQELITAEAHSLHIYRRGKIATFLDELYKDWIIPHIVREIKKGRKWITELTIDELQAVSDRIAENSAHTAVKDVILKGHTPTQEEVDAFKVIVKDEFIKRGSKAFIEIVENELKDAPLSIRVNVMGKQKDLAGLTDKLVNVFRTIVANPTILQDPTLSKLFNRILQSSGLDPIEFTSFGKPIQQPQPIQEEQTV